MKEKYALLMGNEDGRFFNPLEPGEEKNLVQVKEDYGIERFVESHDSNDPYTWSTQEAVLIRYEVLMPREKKVVTELTIDD